MLKTEQHSVMNFENAIRGARNAMNSWDRMDSQITPDGAFVFGENDLKLAMRLRNAGSDHRKFLRQIFVSVDITAPLYWWKEFDTYKIGTTANSTSTMHKLHSTPIIIEHFSHDHMDAETLEIMGQVIDHLEKLRLLYIESKDKSIWYNIIQLLPSSYNQMRTCTLNYENLINIYYARQNHKLLEWHVFCGFIESLPYARELIIGEK